MKKQKSSIIVLSSPESSDDESEKAKPKIDKEELRKYLQNSDEEDESPQKTSPKKSKKLVKKRKTSSHNNVDQDKLSKEIKKPKKLIHKDSPQKYLLQGDDFKKLQKKAKKLGAVSLDYSQRKNNKYMVEYDNKKFTSVLTTLKTSLLTKIQFVETSISQRPRKFQTKTVNLLTSYHLIQIIGRSNF